MGNPVRLPLKLFSISIRSMFPHLIGTTELLFKFTCRPAACPKSCNIAIRLPTSSRRGFRKIAASSAYRDIRNFATLFVIGDRIL